MSSTSRSSKGVFGVLAMVSVITLTFAAACQIQPPPVVPTPTSTAAPTPTPPPTPSERPILTEAQATDLATRQANWMERIPGQNRRDPKARLMTLGEYQERWDRSRSVSHRAMPVWVVTVEGEWDNTPAGAIPPESKFIQGVTVIEAHTGRVWTGDLRYKPIRVEEAVGLDPASFPAYPLEVRLSNAKEAVEFPVSEPGYVPDGFSLERVTLEITDPLSEALPEGAVHQMRQAAVFHYADALGHRFQLIQAYGSLFVGVLDGAKRATVWGREAWSGGDPGKLTWLAWAAGFPIPSMPRSITPVTYALRSPDGSVPLDALFKVAESLPAGQQLPTPTPAPTSTPTPRQDWGPSGSPFRLDLNNGVVASFEWYGPQEKAAFITHVPSGAQAKVDESGQVLGRHDGRGDGKATLDALLADQDVMRTILDGLAAIKRAPQSTVDWINFIKFEGITYLARRGLGYLRIPGEGELTEADLGDELYRVAFRVADRAGPGYWVQDGDAGYLSPGTPVYAIRGFGPQFRLAAFQDGSVVIFEADTNPNARTGTDLLDIEGKVRAVAFYDGDGLTREVDRIDDPAQVADMVRMVLAAPVDQTQLDKGDKKYLVAFLLNDGSASTRWYRTESARLSRGIQVPREFEAYLGTAR
ncbi:MAG: hypothetical protein Q8P22_02430 [Chloroflexota bacterium]|nr:hypothetical protein [Chloroflexota bacterium]